jgi:hypothetical protein
VMVIWYFAVGFEVESAGAGDLAAPGSIKHGGWWWGSGLFVRGIRLPVTWYQWLGISFHVVLFGKTFSFIVNME